MKLIDISGQRFGRLLVIDKANIKNSSAQTKWNCKCDCGKLTCVTGRDLKKFFTSSCGCLRRENKANLSHGKSDTSVYKIWQLMKYRCYSKKCKQYKYYGARGVVVCDRWKHSFENFNEDMGDRPTTNLTLDRFPNMDGNYEPSNCRWATMKEQCANRRSNIWINYNGKSMIVSEWATILKTNQSNMSRMLKSKSFSEVYDFYNNKLKKTNPYLSL